MTLIACPECAEQVSDRARACPRCGFPVADEIGRVLADITGSDRIRSARQKAAAEKLQKWATHYVEDERGHRRNLRNEEVSFLERHGKIVIFAVVVLILVLQVAFVLSAIG